MDYIIWGLGLAIYLAVVYGIIVALLLLFGERC
jgi:hypothetical protein